MKNGEYTFKAIVLPEGEDYDGESVGSKDITVKVTKLNGDGEAKSEYQAEEAADGTLNITQSNVQLAYYNWTDTDYPEDSTAVTLNTISKDATSQTIKNYVGSSGNGYVVVFVKPDDNCLFTGLGATGAGHCFAVKDVTSDSPFETSDYLDSDSKGIGNYPGLQYVVKAAYDAGYKAVFGWRRDSSSTSLTMDFTTIATTPTMTLTVGLTDEDANKTNVKPGDTLTFNITVTIPTVTNTIVKSVKITNINGEKVDITPEATSDVDETTGFGTYKTTTEYTITQADYEAGQVVMKISADVRYACTLGMTSGSVATESTITETANATATPGPNFASKANVTYAFESATTDKSLPDSVTSLKPSDVVVPVGESYTAKQPTSIKVEVDGGYWKFNGWDKDSATPTAEGDTVTFTGKWEFVDTSMTVTAPSGSNITKVYDGTALAPEATSNVDDATITYSTTYNEDTKTWSDYKEIVPSLTDAGGLKVNVKAEKSGYESVTSEYTLTVTKRPVTFTGETATSTYTGSEINLTKVTSESGKDKGLVTDHTSNVTASAKGTTVGVYDGTITANGDVNITAPDPSDSSQTIDVTKNYDITTTAGKLTIVSQSVNPKKDDGSDENDPNYSGITVTAPNDVVYDGTAHQLEPTVKDKDDNNLTKDKDYTLTYKGDTTNAGTVTITVTGKDNYSGSVTTSYKITQRPVVFVGESDTRIYTGAKITLDNVEVSTGDDQGLISGHESNVVASASGTDVGTYNGTIIAADLVKITDVDNKDVTSNYKITTTAGTLTIQAKSIEDISVGTLKDIMYDGTEHALVPSVKNGNTDLVQGDEVDNKDYTVSYSTTDLTNATPDGTLITVTITGHGNYSGTVTRTFAITKRPIKFVGKSDSKVYNGQDQMVSGYDVGTEDGIYPLVDGHTATLEASATRKEQGTTTGTITDASAVVIKASDGTTEVTANYDITTVPGSMTITAKSVDSENITVSNPDSPVYDGNEHKYVPVITDDGKTLIEDKDYTVTYSTDNFTDANDEITMTITGKGDYSGTVTKTYSIRKRAIEFVGNSDSKVFNGTTQEVTGYTVSNETGKYTLVSGHIATLSASASGKDVNTDGYAGTITDSEKVKVAAADLSDPTKTIDVTNNYAITTTAGKLIITAKPISTNDIDVSGLEDVTYNGKEQKQEPTVTYGDITLEKGDADKTRDYTVTYSSSSESGDDYTNAGNTVTVTITGTGNYSGTITKTYKIDKAPLTVTTKGASKTYDGDPLTAKGSIEGFVNDETATFTVTGSQLEVGSSLNTYTLVFDKNADANNYEVKTESLGQLVVSKSTDAIVISTSNSTYTYDGTPHGSTVTVTGLPKGYEVKYTADTIVTDATDENGVVSQITGVQILNTQKEDVTSEYTIDLVPGTIKVNPATLKVKLDGASKVYDGSALTAGGSIKGFVNGEGATFAVTGVQTNVGTSENTYTLSWDGSAREANYILDVEKGNLTVEAQHLTPVTDPKNPDKEDPNYKGVTSDVPQDAVYDGTEHKFVPVVKSGDTELTPGVDYDVTYSTDDFTNVNDEIKVIITGKGNYSGTIEKTYKITPRSIDPSGNSNKDGSGDDTKTNILTTTEPTDVTYDGEEHKFVPEVTFNGKVLTPGVDYDVAYSTDDFTNPGEITVTITGKGNYTGTIVKTYKILEKEEAETPASNTNNTTKNTDNKASTTSASTISSVSTGDASNMILWIFAIAIALVAVVAATSLKKRK